VALVQVAALAVAVFYRGGHGAADLGASLVRLAPAVAVVCCVGRRAGWRPWREAVVAAVARGGDGWPWREVVGGVGRRRRSSGAVVGVQERET
jgi:hypothetical protein